MQKVTACIALIIISLTAFSSDNSTNESQFNIDPPFWYSDMENDTLMLLIQGKKIRNATFDIKSNYGKLLSVERMTSKNYVALYLQITPGNEHKVIPIKVNGKEAILYEIKERVVYNPSEITSSDNMYLIMPDRFANGDISNDNIKGFHDVARRNKLGGRHGGDLKGITDNLKYLDEMGVTSLLLNPAWESNQTKGSYHGYACTNFYDIDARLGTLTDYQNLSNHCKQRDIGLVMDFVYNHIGSDHPWMKDIPDSNWINWHETFTNSNYRAAALADPHASEFDKDKYNNGWFVPSMPDLNQKDPQLAQYLIQCNIWWIQTAKLSGYRIDTYGYPDNEFMKRANRAVKKQFPECYIYGEIWEIGHAAQAWYSPNFMSNFSDQGVDGLTDYNLYFAINNWQQEDEGWSLGLGRLYYSLTADVLYSQPNKMLTFVDNHDQDRYFGKIDGDFRKWKQGIGFLLTTRGIPCIYYGTELLWKDKGDHGGLRRDFPGGWEGDAKNCFTSEGRTNEQNAAHDYLKKLMNFRKENKDVFEGELIHFAPEEGMYVYVRKSEKRNVLVVLSNSRSDQMLDLTRFREILPNNLTITELFSGVKMGSDQPLWIQNGSIFIGYYDN